MKAFIKSLLLLALVSGIQVSLSGQCKTFTKNECKPKLSPYIYNGQLNSAVLNEGDFAELLLTFYSNQDYRVVVCGAEELGPIIFKLIDDAGNPIFTNEDHEMIDHWDFHTNSTQQLHIEVSVPESSDGESFKSGCVSILVGFMDNQD